MPNQLTGTAFCAHTICTVIYVYTRTYLIAHIHANWQAGIPNTHQINYEIEQNLHNERQGSPISRNS